MDRQQIETEGYRAMIADHCELVNRVAQMEGRIAQLEYLMSEEIMGNMMQPAAMRVAVVEQQWQTTDVRSVSAASNVQAEAC